MAALVFNSNKQYMAALAFEAGGLSRRSRARRLVEGIKTVLVVAGWGGLLVQALPNCDHHRLSPFRQFAGEILAQLPKGALLLTQGDLVTNTVRYLWAVEGERRDVAVIDQNLLTAVWFTRMQGHLFADVVFPHVHGRLSVSKRTPTNFNCAQLLDANIARRPIFVVNGFKDDTWQGGYQLVPAGLVQRVLPRRAATGNAHAYNATRWLEDVIQGIGGIVGPAKRILTALRPRPDTVDGAHAACCVGSLVCAGSQGLAEGDGEAGDADSTCAVETQRDRGPAFEGMWRRRRGVRDRGFSRGSWEYKVQLELLAALQRVALHALQVLQAESGAVCATGVCLGPLEELAQALESALLRLADQPGIGAAYKNLGILYQRLLEMEPLSGAEGRMPHDEIAHAARRRIVDAVRRAWQEYTARADAANDPQLHIIQSLLRTGL